MRLIKQMYKYKHGREERGNAKLWFHWAAYMTIIYNILWICREICCFSLFRNKITKRSWKVAQSSEKVTKASTVSAGFTV